MEVDNGRSREKEIQEHVGARWCRMEGANGGPCPGTSGFQLPQLAGGTHLLDGRAEGEVGWWKDDGVVVEVDGEGDVVIHQVGVVVEVDGGVGSVVPSGGHHPPGARRKKAA